MNSICPMNFFRTTDTTDTTIWKPSLNTVLVSTFFPLYTTNQITCFFIIILCKTNKHLASDAGKKHGKHIKQFNINLNHVLSGYWKTKAIQNRKNIAKL